MRWPTALLLCGAPLASALPALPPSPFEIETDGPELIERDENLDFVEAFRARLHQDAAQAHEFADVELRLARARGDRTAATIVRACKAEALAWMEGPKEAWPLIEPALEANRGQDTLTAVVLENIAAELWAMEGDVGSALDQLHRVAERTETIGGPLVHFHHLVAQYEMRFEGDALLEDPDLLEIMRDEVEAHELLDSLDTWPRHYDRWNRYMAGLEGPGDPSRDTLLEDTRGSGQTLLETLTLYDRALAYWFEDELDLALANAISSLEAARRGSYLVHEGYALELHIQILLEREQNEAAWAKYEVLNALASDRGLGTLEHFTNEAGKAVAAARGDSEQLLALYVKERNAAETRDESWSDLFEARGALVRREREGQASRKLMESQIRWGLAAALAVTSLLLAFVVAARVRLRRANEKLQREMLATQIAESSRLESERRLQRIERLKGLGVIAGGVAHDFNNLLTGVLGNADLMIESGELSADLAHRAQAIQKAGERGADLCQRLLVYAGQTPAFNDRVELNELTTNLLPVLRTAAGSDVELIFEPAQVEAWVSANSTRIDQILLNLVTNARDAQANRISIRVEEQRRTKPGVQGRERFEHWVVLVVQDDGQGMDEHVREHLFEPFFTTRFDGRGLGLAEVYGVANEVGGHIDVISEPGRGATFRVQLPRLPGAFDDDSKLIFPQPPAKPGKNGRYPADRITGTAMVVDDEPHVRELTCEFLRSFGMDAVSAASGEEALMQLDQMDHRPRCVLVDMTMPGLTGSELLERIRRRDRELPVVLMSGSHQAEVLARVAGARTPVLSKPFKSHDLQRAVVRALG